MGAFVCGWARSMISIWLGFDPQPNYLVGNIFSQGVMTFRDKPRYERDCVCCVLVCASVD